MPARAVWHRLITNRKLWLGCLLALAATQFARQFYAAATETQTFDESIHIGAGYSFLRSGDYSYDPEHPPLGRVLATLPLLALDLDPKFDTEGWRIRDLRRYGQALLYRQPKVRAETILLVSRTVPILLTVALTLLVGFWARARFGPGAGLLAAVLAALEPNLAAHGHIVTTDLPATVTVFLACVAFERMLRRRTWLDVVWLGLALGAAFSSKFSAVFLAPSFLIVCAMTRRAGFDALLKTASAGVLALLALMASYGPATLRVNPSPWADEALRVDAGLVARVLAGSPTLHRYVVAHPLWRGMNIITGHQDHGHHSYMLGEISEGGRRDYFPFAFLVKTPLGTLLLILLTLPLLRRMDWDPHLALVVPLVVFWSLCISARINIGLRHLLPVYPLMFVLAAGWFATRARAFYGKATPALAAVALVLLAGESAAIAPHDLAFFNSAAGGPANGPNLLVDSNLDWGQDLANLRRWLGPDRQKNVCLVYFGLTDVTYYGFRECGLPMTSEIRAGYEPDRRWAAISATALAGVYYKREWFEWLRERRPAARVGWSIYVYDVNDLRPTRRTLD